MELNKPRKKRSQLGYYEGNILLGQPSDDRCRDIMMVGQSYRILLGVVDTNTVCITSQEDCSGFKLGTAVIGIQLAETA
jgi:hypothetical protein